MLIWKERIPVETAFGSIIQLPFKTKEEAKEHILKVGLQHGEPTMWYQADSDEKGYVGEKKCYIIHAIGTGHDYTNSSWRQLFCLENYIGTVLATGGTLVLHYFLTDEADNKGLFKPRII